MTLKDIPLNKTNIDVKTVTMKTIGKMLPEIPEPKTFTAMTTHIPSARATIAVM